MKSVLCLALALSSAAFCPLRGAQLAESKKTSLPAIYDARADGAKAIAGALANAKKQKKHVLVQFGANWCSWCHKLHRLFDTDKAIAQTLKANFIVVLVDVNKEHNKSVDATYGHPTRFGLPVLVVLDAEGKPLTTKDTTELEEGDHHSPQKVLAFLKQWAPPATP